MAGYIGPIPVPQATQNRETFTATASQTSFATGGGYQSGYLDVFMNGVKLVDGSDYTATNGSDVVLATGAAVNDIIEVVSYSAFEVLNQNFTGTTVVDDLTVGGNLTVTKLSSAEGVLELDDNGTHNGIINAPASLFVNLDSDDTVNTEAFILGKNRAGTSGGVELFRIQEDGDVGLGTDSPSRKLTIQDAAAQMALISDNAQSSILNFGDTDDDNVGRIQYNHSDNSMRIRTNTVDRLHIDSSGNLSIGSTDDNPFSFGGSSNNVSITASGANDWAHLSLKGKGTGATAISLGAGSVRHAGIFSSPESHLDFATNSTNSGTSLTTHMRITSAGNVGVGTSSPTSNYGTNLNVHSSATNGAALHLTDGTTGNTNNDGFHLISTGGLAYVWNRENADMVFATHNTERMRLDSNGAVTMPYQPAFGVINNTAGQNNMAVNTYHTVVFGGEIFDQGNDFASNTFTTPVSGRYQFNVQLRVYQVDTAAVYYQAQLVTSNHSYEVGLMSPEFTADAEYVTLSGSFLADMDASDTAFVRFYQRHGSAQTDLQISCSTFSGYLVA